MATNQNRASLIAASVGLSVIALMGSASAAPPAPPAPPAPVPVTDVQEDEPGWDCNTMGDRSCHAADATVAWQAWDYSLNAQELGNQHTSVEYVGKSDVPASGHMLVDGYLFRIIYPTI